MLALINDRRLQRGQPPLGFLNPALYRLRERGHGGALFDVSGAGSGCSAAVRGEAGILPPAAILHGRGPSPFCFRGAPQRSSGPLLPAANRPGGRTALPAAAQGLAARGGPTPGRGTARTPPTSGTRCPRCPAPSPPSSPTADRCPPRTSAGAYRRSEPQKPHNTSKPQRDERGGWRGGGLYTPAPGPALLMNMQICPHRGAGRVTPPKRRRCAST